MQLHPNMNFSCMRSIFRDEICNTERPGAGSNKAEILGCSVRFLRQFKNTSCGGMASMGLLSLEILRLHEMRLSLCCAGLHLDEPSACCQPLVVGFLLLAFLRTAKKQHSFEHTDKSHAFAENRETGPPSVSTAFDNIAGNGQKVHCFVPNKAVMFCQCL